MDEAPFFLMMLKHLHRTLEPQSPKRCPIMLPKRVQDAPSILDPKRAKAPAPNRPNMKEPQQEIKQTHEARKKVEKKTCYKAKKHQARKQERKKKKRKKRKKKTSKHARTHASKTKRTNASNQAGWKASKQDREEESKQASKTKQDRRLPPMRCEIKVKTNNRYL